MFHFMTLRVQMISIGFDSLFQTIFYFFLWKYRLLLFSNRDKLVEKLIQDNLFTYCKSCVLMGEICELIFVLKVMTWPKDASQIWIDIECLPADLELKTLPFQISKCLVAVLRENFKVFNFFAVVLNWLSQILYCLIISQS